MSDEITLRDTFAAAAMTGMMAHGHWPTHDGGAQDAWKAADAMLRARGDTPCTTLTDAERKALVTAREWCLASAGKDTGEEVRREINNLLARLGGGE